MTPLLRTQPYVKVSVLSLKQVRQPYVKVPVLSLKPVSYTHLTLPTSDGV